MLAERSVVGHHTLGFMRDDLRTGRGILGVFLHELHSLPACWTIVGKSLTELVGFRRLERLSNGPRGLFAREKESEREESLKDQQAPRFAKMRGSPTSLTVVGGQRASHGGDSTIVERLACYCRCHAFSDRALISPTATFLSPYQGIIRLRWNVTAGPRFGHGVRDVRSNTVVAEYSLIDLRPSVFGFF